MAMVATATDTIATAIPGAALRAPVAEGGGAQLALSSRGSRGSTRGDRSWRHAPP